jgi:Zn-dependent peptidase ImmA (M78 family)
VKKDDIEQRAREILRDHGLLDMPVDPVRLANELGIKVYNAKFGQEDLGGLLALRDKVPTIYVSADDRPTRKRFTVAHEIGHFVLHLLGHDGEFVDTSDNFRTVQDPDASWTPERRMEWEANTFAAALLMERDLVRRKWNEIGDLKGMSLWFQVSDPAMAFRLDALGIST